MVSCEHYKRNVYPFRGLRSVWENDICILCSFWRDNPSFQYSFEMIYYEFIKWSIPVWYDTEKSVFIDWKMCQIICPTEMYSSIDKDPWSR